MSHSWDYGVYEVLLDGKPLGDPIDLYGPTVAVFEHVYADVPLEAGKHTLTFRNVGKADQSKGYYFGIDGVLAAKRQ